LWI